jgi:AMP deaminase
MSNAEIQELLRQAVELRLKYVDDYDALPPGAQELFSASKTEKSNYQGKIFDDSHGFTGSYKFESGVLIFRDSSNTVINKAFTLSEFYDDMDDLFLIRQSGPVMSYCYQRLELLETKFELYLMVYQDMERSELQKSSHRDFYNVRKVDTHVHHSAAMNAKYLLRFIERKLEFSPDDLVLPDLTLRQLFANLKIDPYDISLDKLNVLADKTTLHRFDRFNAKYSPFGEPMLRTIFLKSDNFMKGKYLGEITRSMLNDLEDSKYQHTEWRLSIYGRNLDEWDKLAKWVLANNLLSPNNRWMIQIPRLYSEYRKKGEVKTFGELLENIFKPLAEVIIDPLSHPELNVFLKHVSGFDTVDDESKSPLPNDRLFSSREKTPEKWDLIDNPSYKYYSFYIYQNIKAINALKLAKDQTAQPFAFRPHAGEAGEIHHLDTAFLLADRINHGINLRRCPSLQYLFYVFQIGIALSPCSNNQLFLAYDKNPFGQYFERGLNVSLSTDDPLMFHQTKEPLIEEYSIAKQVWRMSTADLCEIARNSVLQSGYLDSEKRNWLGSLDRWVNYVERTNVPNVRIRFRLKTFVEEWALLTGQEQLDSLELFTTQQLLGSPKNALNHGIIPIDEKITGGLSLSDVTPRLKKMRSTNFESKLTSPVVTSSPEPATKQFGGFSFRDSLVALIALVLGFALREVIKS